MNFPVEDDDGHLHNGNEQKNVDEESLIPREYQSVLLEKCLNQNTIVYLPTGSGKTFIAVMLIQRMSGDIKESFTEGGKRTFFMVNTVALVSQQSEFIRRHTPLSVGQYSGDMNVDYWDKEKWLDEINANQVLVMTCQIFLDILLHHYIKLERVNLLIFDECHHAVSDHTMRQVMKLFNHCPEEEQPRVLGLTATLLNSSCKVSNALIEVENLERTYKSTVATVDDLSKVQGFCTNPNERCYHFPESPPSPVMLEVGAVIKRLQCFIKDFVPMNEQTPGPVNRLLKGDLLKDDKKLNKKLYNLLEDVNYHVFNLGLYGGSLAALKHLVQVRRLQKKAEDSKTSLIYQSVITYLNMVRKIMQDAMSDCTEKSRIFKYSTPKVLLLLEVLCNIKSQYNNVWEKPRGIIFVDRRFTAKIIYLILKALHEHEHEKFSFVIPDFVVGLQTNPLNDTREGALTKKWNTEALQKFRKGDTSILVSSDVLEEGIDIPNCNIVIRFDKPKSYRSYVQSKGRARQKSSVFILLVPEPEKEKFNLKYNEYKNIEKVLKEKLFEREKEVEINLSEESSVENLFFSADGTSKVTMTSAVSLVARYCSVLPQDRFTKLTPYFYCLSDASHYQMKIQFPINSKVKEVIEGDPMPNKRLAKRHAALKACEALYKAGELNENLLPRGNQCELIDYSGLAPLDEGESAEPGLPRAGTKKRKRHYKKEYPEVLCECRPQKDQAAYLHVIVQSPCYSKPAEEDTRKLAFYNLLDASGGFAILSSKKLPSLCEFPVFLNIGEVNVQVSSNYEKMFLTSSEIEKLCKFNITIFHHLLKLCKTFMIVDVENKENSYFIVPTKLDESGHHVIDWDVMNLDLTVPNVKPTEEMRMELDLTKVDYNLSVITPWYRELSDQMYIVTKVCTDMSPKTPFPTKDIDSFEEYYKTKYNLVIKNRDQPLVEVKAISNKINCLKPRVVRLSSTTSKRKRQEMQEDFEEHLVPELCFRYTFPSVLWLKATCLPSILHRITHLLLAEELRCKISQDLQFEQVDDLEWDRFTLDPSCWEQEDSSKSATCNTCINNISHVMFNDAPKKGIFSYPWGDEKEPVDIDRQILDELTMMDILDYDEFISKSLTSDNSSSTHNADVSSSEDLQSFPSRRWSDNIHKEDIDIPVIQVLQTRLSGIGPQQAHVLQALTSASACDVVNLERLETLGDSFLKFSTSLFLFLYFPDMNEGKLTHIKGKMVGNSNLFYCGRAQGLGGLMKVQEFSPTHDWCPPGFCVPCKLQVLLSQTDSCPTFLYEIHIPTKEQFAGVLSNSTCHAIESQLLEWDLNLSHTPMESFIGLQSVPDKMIADCVEALIGTYLKGYGIEGAVKLLGWFKILPLECANPEWLLKNPPPSAFLDPCSHTIQDIWHHLPKKDIEALEECLGYHFRDPSFLLQALTHASYIQNTMTDCYQRLEFLGDAILDFLITCHIYETCDNLSPGELTDLRSALVNNITFGSLAVRYNFHKYCKYESSKLFDKVDTFVKFQEQRNHKVNEDVLILIMEKDCKLAESVDVPKVLGDLFESVAGAIYLDSGKSLNEVWRVYYRLMRHEIRDFCKNVPKQPVRMLYEKCQARPFFQKAKTVPDSDMLMVGLEVLIGSRKLHYYGFGENKLSAKRAAAKLALREISGFEIY